MTDIVIEVGCNRGQDTGKLCKKYGVGVHGFEPVPELYNHVTNRYKNNEMINISNCAIDLVNGKRKFNQIAGHNNPDVPSNYGGSSFLELSGSSDFNVRNTHEVETIRIDTYLDSINFDGKIKWLHCDAQGTDLNVLKSFGEKIELLEGGVIEVVTPEMNLYENCDNLIEDCKTFLEENKFQITSMTSNTNNNKEFNMFFKRSADV